MPLTIPDQSIAAQVIQPPDPMTRISQMLNIQGQRIQNSGNQANLDELNSLRSLAQSPDVKNDDGTMNPQKFAARASVVAPTLGAGVAQGNLNNQSTDIANQTNQFALHKDYANTMMQTAQGVLQDPRITAPPGQYDPEQATNALTEAMNSAEAKGVPKAQALLAVAPFVNAVHTPGAVRQMLSNSINGQLGAQGQAGQNLVPASQQQSVTSDSNGNPITINRDQFGAVQNASGVPVPGGAPTPPNIIPQGESADSMNQLRMARAATNNAAGQVPASHTYNQNVIRLASDPAMWNPNSFEGAGRAALAKAGISAGTDYKSTLDMIGHNLAMSTQANEQAMGVSTDAGRQTSGLATGSIAMTPQALATAAKMNDATASGIAAFNNGQEAAIKAAGNNVAARRQFQNQWSNSYSPVVMQIYNAAKSGDTAEIANIAKQSGYTGPISGFASSPQGAELIRRAQAIDKLTKTGSAQ